MVDATNEFIAQSEPWILARDPRKGDRLSQVLYEVAEAVRLAALLLLPVMPASCAEILRRVGESRPVSALRLDQDAVWITSGERLIVTEDPLWPRLEGARRG